MSAQQRSLTTQCPCECTDARGAGLALAGCCGRFLAGERPPTAELLMRSRYSAYVLNDLAYVLATWWPGCAPSDLAPDVQTRWLGLEVKRRFALPSLPLQALPGGVESGLVACGVPVGDRSAMRSVAVPMAGVEFVARYRLGGGSAARLHESSRFAFVAERWWYVDGVVRN
jgi:SEC-C motif domain protein